MPTSIKTAALNNLLRVIPRADLEAMQHAFEWIDLKRQSKLYSAEQAIQYLYFPVSGICSILTRGSNGDGIETGLIGRDGVIGATLCLGITGARFEVLVQVPGTAVRIPAPVFRDIFDRSSETREVIHRYLYVALVQASQTALANSMMTIPQRLARWILMCQDRLDGSEFVTTHEFLAHTLAMRRPGVTLALQELEGQHAIKSTRGKIAVVDRAVLEAMAGTAYGVTESEYRRLLMPEAST